MDWLADLANYPTPLPFPNPQPGDFYELGPNKEMLSSDLQQVAGLFYLYKGVSAVGGLFGAEGLRYSLSVSHKGAMRQTVFKDRPLHLQSKHTLKSK